MSDVSLPDSPSKSPYVVSTKERMALLTKEGNNCQVVDSVPVERYCKAMVQMYEVAHTYLRENQLEKAFILLLRFCNLALEYVRKHKNWEEHHSVAKDRVLKISLYALGMTEDVKHTLEDRFEREFLTNVARLKELKEAERVQAEAHTRAIMERRVREENARAAMQIQMRNQQSRIHNPGVTTDSLSYANLVDAVLPQPGQQKSKPRDLFEQLCSESDPSMKIFIAGDVAQKFLVAAEANTANNVETCGILCGVMFKSRFFITHVILPKQHGTANSCFSEGEEDIFEVQDKMQLLTFGWIHTHPSQTAFLSSVDLHTHHAYQMAVEEAVAIVCAPAFNEIGTFVITPDGMRIIGGCKQSGFHPHPENGQTPIFADATHAKYTEKMAATLVDLRHN